MAGGPDDGLPCRGSHADHLAHAYLRRAPPWPLQLPSMGSDQPTTDSPSHQHACLVILDALATLLDRLSSTGVLQGLGLWGGHGSD